MRHKTAYQKANAALEAEGRRQCGILYGSTALALRRHWGKGRVAILKLFDVTGEVWHTCASTNLHSMIEMCETETGITITNESGKDWRDLPYLNGSLDTVPMTNAQWVYMRQKQKQWIAPQVMGCIMVALHRKYGFGFDRCSRIYSQIQEIAASYGDDPQKIHDACLAETGINITEVYTQNRESA